MPRPDERSRIDRVITFNRVVEFNNGFVDIRTARKENM